MKNRLIQGLNILSYLSIASKGFATAQRNLVEISAPVSPAPDTAALQLSLYVVPGLGDLFLLSVKAHGVLHLSLECIDELLAEDIAEDTTDQNDEEQQQDYDEVQEEHALDLTGSSYATEERYDRDDDTAYEKDVDGTGKQVVTGQFAHVVDLLHQRPDRQTRDDQSSELQEYHYKDGRSDDYADFQCNRDSVLLASIYYCRENGEALEDTYENDEIHDEQRVLHAAATAVHLRVVAHLATDS